MPGQAAPNPESLSDLQYLATLVADGTTISDGLFEKKPNKDASHSFVHNGITWDLVVGYSSTSIFTTSGGGLYHGNTHMLSPEGSDTAGRRTTKYTFVILEAVGTPSVGRTWWPFGGVVRSSGT